jgi:hypothetical protein
MPQKCAPEGESAPHWLQNRPPPTGTNRTGTYLSGEQAQINAINQPITVHPKRKFTRKMPIISALCRPMIVGRKYRSADRIRKVMFSPLSAQLNARKHLCWPLLQDTRKPLVLFQWFILSRALLLPAS